VFWSDWHNIAVWFAQLFSFHFFVCYTSRFRSFSHCNFYFYIVFVSQIVIVLTERSAIVLVFVFVFVTKIAVHTAILCQCDVTQQCERKLASSSSTENSGVVPMIRWLKANEHGHVNR